MFLGPPLVLVLTLVGLYQGNYDMILGAWLGVGIAQLPREFTLLMCGHYGDPMLPPWYKRIFMGQVFISSLEKNQG